MPHLKTCLMELCATDNLLISSFQNSYSSFLASQQAFSQDLALILKAADTAFWSPSRAKGSQNSVAASYF